MSISGPSSPTRATYAGLFLITLSTLMLEVMLTRIFSVTMWYHFAFLAISIAMFGMTVGALFVYLRPAHFPAAATNQRMALYAALFSASTVLSVVALMSIPFIEKASVQGISSMLATYLAASVPFVFSGVGVTLALTRFPDHVGRLYAADLFGAALGCVLLIVLLELTDAPNVVLITALLAATGSLLFALDSSSAGTRRLSLGIVGVLAALTLANSILVTTSSSPLHLTWVKGRREHNLLYEDWNSYSRIAVFGDTEARSEPFGWGMSPLYRSERGVRQLMMNIDASAATVVTAFDGNRDDISYLRYDVSNLAHYLRTDANVLVIGSGGGRDVLSAILFEQQSVTAVEINSATLRMVNEFFGDYTGHLDRRPDVRFVNDEARSFIAHQPENTFDIIQISLIDTWAATAAGAFALTENTLYTVEAWKIFLGRLNDDGILTVTRWFHESNPVEAYRLVSLANAALRNQGISNPRDHMLFARRHIGGPEEDRPEGVGTLLVSSTPFSVADRARFEEVSAELGFVVALSADTAADATFETLATSDDVETFAAAFPYDISPPTDDRPFFFHVLRLPDFLDRNMWETGKMNFNAKAIVVLGGITVIVLGLTALCIGLPLWLMGRRADLSGATPLLAYFMSIGLGFMLVEVAQMQRLIMVLGHPIYALSVVLFTLLVASGIGSGLTSFIPESATRTWGIRLFAALLLVVAMIAVLMPAIAARVEAATTPIRVSVAILTLAPLGLLMGTAFPMGIRLARRRAYDLTPWLWGLNGATSVCASVLAIVISLSAGITAAMWTGAAAYVVAMACFVKGSTVPVSDL